VIPFLTKSTARRLTPYRPAPEDDALHPGNPVPSSPNAAPAARLSVRTGPPPPATRPQNLLPAILLPRDHARNQAGDKSKTQ